MERPNCTRCRHFKVTWENDFGRACTAYGFRSREFPSSVVLKASGKPCQVYERQVEADETPPKSSKGKKDGVWA